MARLYKRSFNVMLGLLVLLALAACGTPAATPPTAEETGSPAPGAAEETGSPAPAATGAELGEQNIRLGYMAWTDCEAFTNIAAEVLRNEGYTVELVPADAGVVYQSLADGQIDAMLCSWQPGTHEDYVNRFQDQIQEATVNLEGARLGWAVPTYVEDVNSIADLEGKAAEFNGEIVGIDPGAGLMRLSAQALDEYGLNNEYNLVESSDAAMTAALDQAIREERPIVVTTWAPHIMWAKYDIKWLEDPQNVLGDAEHISTMVREGFEEDSPRAYEVLSQMQIEPDTLAAVMLEVQEGQAPEAAAEEFVASHSDLVQQWTSQ
jgi:glycine betaine/proline transport system substrate-binding protein